MLLDVFLFVFFALFAKVIIAVAVLYLLLPQRERCACCDGETFATVSPAGCGWIMRAARLESRWCTQCGVTELARMRPSPLLWVGTVYPPGSTAGARSRPVQ